MPILVLRGTNTIADVGPVYVLVMANTFRDDAGHYKHRLGPFSVRFRAIIVCGNPVLGHYTPISSCVWIVENQH